MLFSQLGLSQPILRAVEQEGYTTPTPSQAQTIPHAVVGRDMLGTARTGTGKTAADSHPDEPRSYRQSRDTRSAAMKKPVSA